MGERLLSGYLTTVKNSKKILYNIFEMEIEVSVNMLSVILSCFKGKTPTSKKKFIEDKIAANLFPCNLIMEEEKDKQ